jgi:hypothetical protein
MMENSKSLTLLSQEDHNCEAELAEKIDKLINPKRKQQEVAEITRRFEEVYYEIKK